MALGRAYRIKKSAVKAYGYTKPPKKGVSRGPRFAANGSVTHIAAINGRGAYSTARSRMSGLSANARRARARTALSSAKKKAFARKVSGAPRRNGSSTRSIIARNPIGVKRGYSANKRRASSFRRNNIHTKKTVYSESPTHRKTVMYTPAQLEQLKKKSRRTKKAATSTRKAIMARKTRRKKKSAARKPVARRVKRRVKRRSAKRSAVAPKKRRVKRRKAKKTTLKAAPKRKRRRKTAKKTTLKANRKRRVSRRRLKRNKGTRAGALKGWRKRRAKARKASPKRRRSRKASSAPKRRRRRVKARKTVKRRRLKRNARKATPNRRRRVRRNARRSLSPNRRRRSGSKKRRSSKRRLRRNGRRSMFRKNGIGDSVSFVLKTGGLALGGLVAHKLVSNLFTTQVLNRIFGSGVVVTPTTVAPATAGLGGLSVDPSYQRLAGSALVSVLGILASAKLIKDPGSRNAVMTGIAVSFMHTAFSALVTKFAPQYAGYLAGAEDGTAARLSAMYGLGNATSIMPRYSAIGEYFTGTSGLGEYFSSGVNGLGEYFGSGVNGLGALPAYEAAAGYGSNPDLMEAAAGYGALGATNTNHVDPHGDLERELNIAEAAAGIGNLPSYEAAAGFGAISSLPSSSTWIPGSSDAQLWAGTRAISAPQSASEMVPAGILQTDGGQGVFG